MLFQALLADFMFIAMVTVGVPHAKAQAIASI